MLGSQVMQRHFGYLLQVSSVLHQIEEISYNNLTGIYPNREIIAVFGIDSEETGDGGITVW
jgi:hypothetical protein